MDSFLSGMNCLSGVKSYFRKSGIIGSEKITCSNTKMCQNRSVKWIITFLNH